MKHMPAVQCNTTRIKKTLTSDVEERGADAVAVPHFRDVVVVRVDDVDLNLCVMEQRK
jgi:hypothetical protein